MDLRLSTCDALNYGADRGFNRTSAAYSPSFCMLKDLPAHWDMIEGLKSCFRVQECGSLKTVLVSFNTIFGKFDGHKIYASRKVAEKIEVQTRYAAQSGILTYYLQLQYLQILQQNIRWKLAKM